jgi:outer membrane receptor protein involved in Fe transport
MHSYQLTFGTNQLLPGLNLELNAFYNRTRDLIYMDLIEHYNMGSSDIYGLELSGDYRYRNFSVNLSASWQKATDYKLFYDEYEKPFNMP